MQNNSTYKNTSTKGCKNSIEFYTKQKIVHKKYQNQGLQELNFVILYMLKIVNKKYQYQGQHGTVEQGSTLCKKDYTFVFWFQHPWLSAVRWSVTHI